VSFLAQDTRLICSLFHTPYHTPLIGTLLAPPLGNVRSPSKFQCAILIVKPLDKTIALAAVILNLTYLTWLGFSLSHPAGILIFFGDSLFVSLTILKTINHWTQHHVGEAVSRKGPSVDVFLPVLDEPLDLFENTIQAACGIECQNKRVYILDDLGREEVAALANRYEALYLSRTDKGNNQKAGNLNFGLQHSTGEFILVLDADHVTQPNIATTLLGHFDDPKVAFVATRQAFDVPPGDFNHEPLFYESILPGKNADNAAISCGSGVIYRRSALEHIGNFQSWNIVEDLYTSYVFHIHGFQTVYVNKSFTLGLAPVDLPTIYKQRGTWAADALRIFFKHNPFLEARLKFKQQLHYFEIGWSYLVSAISFPLVMILLAYSLATNTYIIPASDMYLLLKSLQMFFPALLAYVMSKNNFSTVQVWGSLFPVFLWAIVLALRPNKPTYSVTSKIGKSECWHILLMWPHLVLLAGISAALIWHIIHHGLTNLAAAGFFFTGLMLYWFLPFLQKVLGLGYVRNFFPKLFSMRKEPDRYVPEPGA